MKKLVFAALLAAVLILPIIAFASAAEQERPFSASFTGVWTNKDDFSYTGAQGDGGDLAIVTGKSSLGSYIAYEVDTYAMTKNECTNLEGNKGIEIVMKGEVFLLTFDETGDQLFLKRTGGQACYVIGTGGDGTATFDVIGGTGRFVGATGTMTKTYRTVPLVMLAAPAKGRLSSFSGTFEGSIKLASENAWPF